MMTPSKRVIAALIATFGLGGCAIAHPAAPAVTSKLSTQSLQAPTEVLVKFRTRATPQTVEAFGAEYGLRPKERIDAIDVHVMTIVSSETATVIVTRLKTSPLVEYAEPNARLSLK